MEGVTFRWLGAGETAVLLPLLRASFGTWPGVTTPVSASEHLEWKTSFQEGGGTAHAVGEVDGEVVACQLAVYQPYLFHGSRVTIFRGWDSAVHPRLHGQGIMRDLRAFVRERSHVECDAHIGAFTRSPAMLRLHEYEGRIAVGAKLETLIAPLTLGSAIDALKLRSWRSFPKAVRSAGALARWAIGRRSPAAPVQGCTVRDAGRFDERVTPLFEEASGAFDAVLERTPAFLNWRYADRRGGEFAIKLAEESERLVGYTVLRVTGGHAYIADLLVMPGRDDVLRALAGAALAHFRGSGLDALECMIPAWHPYVPILQDCGFVGRRVRKTPFSFLPLRMTPAELSFLQDPDLRLHLLLGDSDTI